MDSENQGQYLYQYDVVEVKEVDGDGIGPWVSAGGHTITIYALGDQVGVLHALLCLSIAANVVGEITAAAHDRAHL